MFQHAAALSATQPDDRRVAGAATLAVAAAGVLLASYSGATPALEEAPDEPPMTLFEAELVEAVAPPAPAAGGGSPAPPRPTARPAAAPAPTPPEPEPEPGTMADPTDSAPAVADLAPPEGPEDPSGTGDPEGAGPGTGGKGPGTGHGPGTGPGLGSGGGFMDVPAATPRRKIYPVYPPAASEMGLREARCGVRFEVDHRGHPVDVSVMGCPQVFHVPTREAALKWRFYPVKVGGQAVPARFTLVVRYTADAADRGR